MNIQIWILSQSQTIDIILGFQSTIGIIKLRVYESGFLVSHKLYRGLVAPSCYTLGEHLSDSRGLQCHCGPVKVIIFVYNLSMDQGVKCQYLFLLVEHNLVLNLINLKLKSGCLKIQSPRPRIRPYIQDPHPHVLPHMDVPIRVYTVQYPRPRTASSPSGLRFIIWDGSITIPPSS